MNLICSYCGAEGDDHDRANGRCGKCGRFFTGNEEVVAVSIAQDSVAATSESISNVVQRPSVDPVSGADVDTGNDGEGSATPSQPGSEELVRPRRLSPQFKRRVEMTWQPSLAKGGAGYERTLSTHSSSDGTKRDHSSLSIGTRQIKPVSEKGTGDYELHRVIGEGSMGQVWSARQTSLDRNVAVKIPRPELANSGSVGESQFISEVVVTGKLEHPNIVPIYELGRDREGVPFYSMKHVQGRPWNELIDDKSEQENIEILMKVCDAIAFAHDRDFLHRDIKPANVMVGEFGEVSVMDWGIAVSLSKDPKRAWASVASGPAGTPAYMAPEMAAFNPSELGVVSDVYLLGAVLYEIVTGTPPHPRIGDTNDALLAAAANEIIPTSKNGELVDIARRAMATDVKDRYPSVKAFQDALREYQSHRQSIALAESANQHLVNAKKEGSSDEFARARFAYEEALKLWSENAHAVVGLREATIAHAQNALEQENYELGISILDPKNRAHRELLGRLENRRAARRRLSLVSKLAAMIAVGAIVTVAIVMYLAMRQAEDDFEKQKTLSNQNQKLYDEQIDLNNKLSSQQKDLEDKQQKLSITNQSLDEQRKQAVAAKEKERKAKIEAEQASYASEIGIAAASIRRNEFPKAAKTLQDLASGESIVSKLRHIEWGILQHAANPKVESLLVEEPITAVASSSSGDVIAAGTEDGRVFVWFSTEQGQPFGVPVEKQHGSRINAIAVSENGQYLATAGIADGQEDRERFTVRIWDTEGQQLNETKTLSGHSAEVLSVVFSDDAAYVLTSAADRAAIKWDLESGTPLSTIRDHLEKQVWSARFAPDDPDRILTACEDGRVRVWETAGGVLNQVADFRGHSGPVYAADFSADGITVFSGGYDRRLLHWKVADHPPIARSDVDDLLQRSLVDDSDIQLVGAEKDQHASSIRSIAVDEVDGEECILSGGNDNTVRVWTRAQGIWELNKNLRGHGRWVRDCVFSGQGLEVVSGAYDGLKRWSWKEYNMPSELFPNREGRIGQEASELGLSPATGLAYSRDGWIATAYQNGTVALWNAKSGDRMPSDRLGDGHTFLTAAGILYDNGQRLLTSAGDNTTRLWSVDRGAQMLRLDGTGWRGAAAIAWRDQDQTALIVTGSDDRLVPAWLWRVKDDAILSQEPLLENFAASLMDNYSQSMLVRQNRTPIDELSVEDFEQIRRIKRRVPDVTAVAVSKLGDRFLVGNSQGQCFVLGIDEGTDQVSEIDRFQIDVSSVRAAVFSTRDDSVIVASTDGQIIQWYLSGDRPPRPLPKAGPVTALALSADERHLVVGYSPVKGSIAPIARVLDLSENDLERNPVTLPLVAENRDWTDSPPIVQSVRFDAAGDRILLSLFFPNQSNPSEVGENMRAGAERQSSYRLGRWDWKRDDNELQPLDVAFPGEVSSAMTFDAPEGSRLLMVGGKGARLLAADDTGTFTKLTASFRQPAAITAIGFSYDQVTETTQRLVTGEADGNIRIWELVDGKWSESEGAAAQLAGRHSSQIIAAKFDPRNRDSLLTADQSGKWILWGYDQDGWTPRQQVEAMTSGIPLHCVLFSPDSLRVFLGADDHASVWQRDNLAAPFEFESRWETGRVRAATFSEDGNWVVTSDGDEFIVFWDATGREIARHSDEDTKGLTSIDLSWDRRRLFTGHQDGEVNVWDTSNLVDTDAQEIKVLLTLEDHDRSVTSVAVSPDGQSLVSADQAGRTIVSAGEPVRPITITLSRDQINCGPSEGTVVVDPAVMLSDPSRLADFSDAQLLITLERGSDEEARLEIGSLSMGEFKTTDSEASEIRVQLNETSNANTIQAMLRTLTFENPAAKESISLLPISKSESGMEDEQIRETRNLKIAISQIRYRTVDGTQAEYFSLPEQNITIEIETDSLTVSDSKEASESTSSSLITIQGLKGDAGHNADASRMIALEFLPGPVSKGVDRFEASDGYRLGLAQDLFPHLQDLLIPLVAVGGITVQGGHQQSGRDSLAGQ